MRNLFIIVLVSMCITPALAQKPLLGQLGKGLTKELETNVTRLLEQRSLRFADALANYRLVPLKIAGTKTTIPTALAVAQGLTRPQEAVGTLLRKTYLQYQAADEVLDSYVARTKPEGTDFLYRGMHVADLGDIVPLFNGLQVDKTGYNSIYMTSNHAVARHYATVEDGIPVVVSMDRKSVKNSSLRPANIGDFYVEKDVPAEAIGDIFVLLDVNGTPNWHRAMWQDKLVFVPLTEPQTAPGGFSVPPVQLSALPENPLEELYNGVDGWQAVQAQMQFICRQLSLDAELAAYALIPLKIAQTESSSPLKVAVPEESVNEMTTASGSLLLRKRGMDCYKEADRALIRYIKQQSKEEDIGFLCRGMRLTRLDEIENILLNGLEVNKTMSKFIYTTPTLFYALSYAESTTEETSISVLIAIDQDAVAEQLKPTDLRYEFYSKMDISQEAIAHVFVFLDINKQPAWYRVVLQGDDMVFIPLPQK